MKLRKYLEAEVCLLEELINFDKVLFTDEHWSKRKIINLNLYGDALRLNEKYD